jgi:quinol monooxygenase YgiN
MHARVTTARVRPGQAAEATRLVREELLPTARAQPGFRGFLHLADAAAGRVLLLTLWDSEEALEEGEAGGYYRRQLAKLGEVLRGQPTRETLAVEVCELVGEDQPATR